MLISIILSCLKFQGHNVHPFDTRSCCHLLPSFVNPVVIIMILLCNKQSRRQHYSGCVTFRHVTQCHKMELQEQWFPNFFVDIYYLSVGPQVQISITSASVMFVAVCLLVFNKVFLFLRLTYLYDKFCCLIIAP